MNEHGLSPVKDKDLGTKALRGWALGNPIPMWRRRKDPWLECNCTYLEPHLHSLVVEWFHWPGPFIRNPTSTEEAIRMARDRGFSPKSTSRYSSTVITEAGAWMWNMEGSDTAGFYSYKPACIERMGRWKEVDVLGVVDLGGLVIEHDRGYRSEKMLIEKLWVLWESSRRFPKERLHNHLEETYRCDVVMLQKKLYEGFADWLKREEVENLL